jgi:hypothetical protein
LLNQEISQWCAPLPPNWALRLLRRSFAGVKKEFADLDGMSWNRGGVTDFVRPVVGISACTGSAARKAEGRETTGGALIACVGLCEGAGVVAG